MHRRVIAITVCGLLCGQMLLSAGCSQKQRDVEGTQRMSVSNDRGNASAVSPVSEEPITLRWATHENYYEQASLSSGLEVWKEIEKKTNVTIEWDVLPYIQYDAAMQVKLAAGNDLPDLVVVPGFDPTPYGQSGLFIALEDLLEQYAPNILEVFKEYPGARELMTSADQHIYGLAPIVQGSAETLQPTFTIRKDWLDKLGLQEPDTLEQWVDVLKAFKEKDPNDNGEADEIPFCSTPHYFAEAFGLQLMSGSDYMAENGKVIYQWADPRMEKYLEFAHMLYSEGLLGFNYWKRTWNLIQPNVTANRVGAYVSYPDWIHSWQKKLNATGDKEGKYIPILPPKGENGERSLDTTTVIDKRFSSITKACKHPILAVKFLDYLWSEEGIQYMAWGIEGKTYVVDDDKPQFAEFVKNNPYGLGMSDALRTVGAWPTIPWVQQREQYVQMLSLFPGFENFPQLIKPILKEPFPMLLAGKEQQERLMILEKDISNYREEMIDNFIIGKESLESFQEYIDTLHKMGLDELLQIKQKQYDMYINSKN